MRQLRLREKDTRYAFLYQGVLDEEIVEKIRKYLIEQSESIKEYSFAEAPLGFQVGKRRYQAGFVPCNDEAVVRLPQKGSVFVMGSKGGFIVAAECENREAG
ncbi:MAG: hypothetical protein ACI4TB_05335 [Lachnospiraceae bacterium]